MKGASALKPPLFPLPMLEIAEQLIKSTQTLLRTSQSANFGTRFREDHQ